MLCTHLLLILTYLNCFTPASRNHTVVSLEAIATSFADLQVIICITTEVHTIITVSMVYPNSRAELLVV